jgi:hypothetical protein
VVLSSHCFTLLSSPQNENLNLLVWIKFLNLFYAGICMWNQI